MEEWNDKVNRKFRHSTLPLFRIFSCMKILSIVVPLFLSAPIFIGCSENISSVGSKFFEQRFAVTDTSLFAIGDSTFHSNIANGTGYYDLVGAAKSVEAKTFLNFTGLYEGDGDTLGTVQLAVCELQFHVGYLWNMSGTAQQFEAHEILSPWTSAVPVDSSDDINVNPTACGSVNRVVVDTTVIIIPLDTNVVRKWITALTDSTAPRFYGWSIMAPSGASSTGIFGFPSFDLGTNSPKLAVRYTKNGVEDSVIFTYGSDAFLAKNFSPISSSLIEVQGGVGRRSKIMFNLGALVNKPIINNASLVLTLNSSLSSHGTSTPDSVLVRLISNAQYPDTINSSYFYYGQRKDTAQTANPVYSIPLSSLTQAWVNNIEANYGILLEAANENSSVDRYVFYSSADPDSTKRPVLRVTYTKR
ncbi:MAG: DNRLRE domain-containing protein [Bacteroidota bacterium]|nr:DNRLRE domain-containing protein [Bacteroidota bacterium]